LHTTVNGAHSSFGMWASKSTAMSIVTVTVSESSWSIERKVDVDVHT
jgi:hypothetical protein